MKSPVVKGVIAILILLGVVTAFSPYVTVRQIESALNQKDSVKLAEYVDFPVLRTNLKEQLTAMMFEEMRGDIAEDPLTILAMGLGTQVVGGLIDVLLTPQGLAALVSGESIDSASDAAASTHTNVNFRANIARVTIDGLSRISLWIQNDDGDQDVRLLLYRHGLKWRLSNIVM